MSYCAAAAGDACARTSRRISTSKRLVMFGSGKFFLILCFSLIVVGQDFGKKALGDEKKKAPVKKGPDGRPLLFGPNIEKCKSRKLFEMHSVPK